MISVLSLSSALLIWNCFVSMPGSSSILLSFLVLKVVTGWFLPFPSLATAFSRILTCRASCNHMQERFGADRRPLASHLQTDRNSCWPYSKPAFQTSHSKHHDKATVIRPSWRSLGHLGGGTQAEFEVLVYRDRFLRPVTNLKPSKSVKGPDWWWNYFLGTSPSSVLFLLLTKVSHK